MSCLDLFPAPAALYGQGGGERLVCVVGTWTALSVRFLALPSLAPLLLCGLGGDTQVSAHDALSLSLFISMSLFFKSSFFFFVLRLTSFIFGGEEGKVRVGMGKGREWMLFSPTLPKFRRGRNLLFCFTRSSIDGLQHTYTVHFLCSLQRKLLK